MTEQRRGLLEQKLTANAARRAREAYLARLPGEYRDYLESCEIVQDDARQEASAWFEPGEDGLGWGKTRHRPTDYRYRSFGWAHKALAQAAALPDTHDAAEAFFCPFGGNPIYQVDFGWVRARIAALWEFSPEMLGVVRQDFRAGIVLSNYCGRVPGDWNPDEVVYELAVWGFGRSG